MSQQERIYKTRDNVFGQVFSQIRIPIAQIEDQMSTPIGIRTNRQVISVLFNNVFSPVNHLVVGIVGDKIQLCI